MLYKISFLLCLNLYLSAYEVKTNLCLFERPFKEDKNGVLGLNMSLLPVIFTFFTRYASRFRRSISFFFFVLIVVTNLDITLSL